MSLVDTAIQEIDRAATEDSRRPFFTFLSLLSPHGPVDPPGRWATAMDDRPLPRLNYMEGEEEQHPQHLRFLVGIDEKDKMPRQANGTADVAEIERQRRLYYGLA